MTPHSTVDLGPSEHAPPSDAEVEEAPDAARSEPSGLGNAALTLIDQALVSGTSFVTSVLVGRFAPQPQAALGAYALAMTFVLLARSLQEQLVFMPYMVYSHRRSGGARFLGSNLLQHLALSVLAALVVAAAAAVAATGYWHGELFGTLAVLACVLPGILLREFVRSVAYAQFRVRAVVELDAISCLLQLFGLGTLVALSLVRVPFVYLAMAGAASAGCVYWRFRERPRWEFSRTAVADDWRQNWQLGRWALVGQLPAYAAPIVVPWVLASRAADGQLATGLYAACSTLVGPANLLLTGLNNLAGPRAARSYTRGGVRALRQSLLRSAALFLAALGACAVVFVCAGDLLLRVFYAQPQFAAGWPVVVLLSLHLLVTSVSVTASNGLLALERSRANLLGDFVTAGVMLPAAWLLTPSYGVTGAAAGVLAASTLGAVVRLGTLRAHLAWAAQRAAGEAVP